MHRFKYDQLRNNRIEEVLDLLKEDISCETEQAYHAMQPTDLRAIKSRCIRSGGTFLVMYIYDHPR